MPEDPQTPVVFLSGGIGITPVRSMLRAEAGVARPVWLFYGNTSLPDAPFYDEMVTLCDMPCRTMIPVLTNPSPMWTGERGYITEEMIRAHVPDPVIPRYYIIGTGGFVAAMRRAVAAIGVPTDHVVTDDFGAYATPTL